MSYLRCGPLSLSCSLSGFFFFFSLQNWIRATVRQRTGPSCGGRTRPEVISEGTGGFVTDPRRRELGKIPPKKKGGTTAVRPIDEGKWKGGGRGRGVNANVWRPSCFDTAAKINNPLGWTRSDSDRSIVRRRIPPGAPVAVASTNDGVGLAAVSDWPRRFRASRGRSTRSSSRTTKNGTRHRFATVSAEQMAGADRLLSRPPLSLNEKCVPSIPVIVIRHFLNHSDLLVSKPT